MQGKIDLTVPSGGTSELAGAVAALDVRAEDDVAWASDWGFMKRILHFSEGISENPLDDK